MGNSTLFRHLSQFPQAVFLDFNGVLVDDEHLHFVLFQEVLAKEGIYIDREGYEEKYIALDDVACFQAAYRDNGRPYSGETIVDLVREKAALYKQKALTEAPFFEGATELMVALKAAGIPTAIVSGALEEEILYHLDRAGMGDWPPVIVSAEKTPESKPDPAPYKLALRQLAEKTVQLDNKNCLAIEDTSGGVSSATGAGINTIAVLNTTPADQLLAAGASMVIPNLSSLLV